MTKGLYLKSMQSSVKKLYIHVTLIGYYNGILEDIRNESINTGEECEAGLKMVFVIGEIYPREPPGII